MLLRPFRPILSELAALMIRRVRTAVRSAGGTAAEAAPGAPQFYMSKDDGFNEFLVKKGREGG